MSKTKKRVIMLLCVFALMTVLMTSAFAFKYKCTGGGDTDVPATHSFGPFWMYSHNYTYNWHNAIPLDGGPNFGSFTYKEYGHYVVTGCGRTDFDNPCPVNGTFDW